MSNNKQKIIPLTPAVFHILLALVSGDRHGYDIIGQVKEDSEGRILMGPGTLYGSIDRMIKAGLVENSPKKSGDIRRIYYRLTANGIKSLQHETHRLSAAVRIAGLRNLNVAISV